ncbi:unnamed protein product, partial [marine sediment metagenome]
TPNELWFTDDAGTDTQLGVGGGGLWSEGVDLIHPTTADEALCDDSNCTHWSISGAGVAAFAGAVSGASFTADPDNDAEVRLITNTLGAEASMGITEFDSGPDAKMDLSVDEDDVHTMYIQLDGVGA